MRTTYLIAAAVGLLGLSAFAASEGPKGPGAGLNAGYAATTTQDQTPAPGTGVCPNGCTPGSGCGRGYCGGRGMNAQAGPKGPMAGRGMRTGPRDGTGPRRDGSCMYDQGLVAGTTVTCQVDPIIPETLAAGTYYVGAFADDMMQVGESNRKNNALVNQNGATSIISLASGLPNLEVVSFVAATKGVIGRALPQMRVEVRNRGGAPAGPFRIGYYVSKTPNIESDGLYTKWSCLVDSGLRPGESRVCSGSIQIRPDLEAGLYYLAAFVDDLRQVREGDETNNIRVNDLGQVQLEKPAPAPGNLLFPWQ